MLIHILRDRFTTRPWWPTEARLFGRGRRCKETVVTDCCCRRVLATKTMCRLHLQEFPVNMDRGDYQEHIPWLNPDGTRPISQWEFSYFEPYWEIVCNPKDGCNTNKKLLRGKDLREFSRYGG